MLAMLDRLEILDLVDSAAPGPSRLSSAVSKQHDFRRPHHPARLEPRVSDGTRVCSRSLVLQR